MKRKVNHFTDEFKCLVGDEGADETCYELKVGVPEKHKTFFAITGNPVEKHALLHVVTAANEALSLSINDVSGRLLYHTAGTTEYNDMRINLAFTAYASGLYVVTFTSQTASFRTRLLKK